MFNLFSQKCIFFSNYTILCLMLSLLSFYSLFSKNITLKDIKILVLFFHVPLTNPFSVFEVSLRFLISASKIFLSFFLFSCFTFISYVKFLKASSSKVVLSRFIMYFFLVFRTVKSLGFNNLVFDC